MNAMCGMQVASVQTLWSRCFRQDKELPPAHVVFVDEAHHCPARTYRQILEAYPAAQIMGMTATPCRRDGRGLGNIFDTLLEGPQVADLIEQGFLVGTKVYAPTKPDLKGVHTRHGDYVESEIAAGTKPRPSPRQYALPWRKIAQTVTYSTCRRNCAPAKSSSTIYAMIVRSAALAPT